jgi:hypothetical protein
MDPNVENKFAGGNGGNGEKTAIFLRTNGDGMAATGSPLLPPFAPVHWF